MNVKKTPKKLYKNHFYPENIRKKTKKNVNIVNVNWVISTRGVINVKETQKSCTKTTFILKIYQKKKQKKYVNIVNVIWIIALEV